MTTLDTNSSKCEVSRSCCVIVLSNARTRTYLIQTFYSRTQTPRVISLSLALSLASARALSLVHKHTHSRAHARTRAHT